MIDSKTLDLINELLTDRDQYHLPQFDSEENEDTVESFRYFRHPEFPEDVFLQEKWEYDSYGEESMTDLRIVRGKERTITIFEPSKY